MAANYWESSQFQRFLLTRYELAEIESTHMIQLTNHEITHLKIYFADLILKIGKRLRTRQEIIATAIVYFKRFYINNTFYDIDPYLMAATCMYLACKVEENPHHIKHIWSESSAMFTETSPDIRFPYDIPDIAECESYLLEEMKFYLVVYHPYQVLIDESIKLSKPALQASWSIINDSYRTDMTLVYPPHVIAVAALFLSRVVDQGNLSDIEAQQWFADLNVDITDVLQVVTELLSLYKVWSEYDEAKMPELVSRYIADIAASS
ncbi:cyclin-like protein [Coemansia spiralis]|uniref:RNA polymerase II holoenzyme cyclin-like subunit n=1 Tax=Coemansia umbellata TaxID=1424467 RepID=A0ABQ8PST9_9FUNG|nr:cyclin-like protein [Coemansia spiralis]KAJ1994956.1 RNA polymerase II holoenzyme cyclin-like subunit [Coemansia umbellata]